MFSTTKLWLKCLALVLMSTMMLPAVASESRFQEGVAAYKQGQYEQALESFKSARDEGMDKPALWLNLGVTAYRLDRDDEARGHFQRLRQESGWEPLADYYLGRLAERNNDQAQARLYYRDALKGSDDPRIRQRSQSALERLGEDAPVPRPSAFLSLSGGYDSNPELLPDSDFANEGEAFAELFGSYTQPLGDGDWRLKGDLFARQYPGNSDLNDAALLGGVLRQFNSDHYRSELGLSVGQFFFGGSTLQRRVQLSGEVNRQLEGGSRVTLGAELNRLLADSDFQELDGLQTRTSLRWRGNLGGFYYRTGYRFEWNDRDDVQEPGARESLSPVRHRIKATLGRTLGDAAWMEGEAGFQNSRYRSRNDVNGEQIRREDDELELTLRTGRALSRHWQIYGEYAFRDRSSSLDRFEAERHLVQLFVVWQGF